MRGAKSLKQGSFSDVLGNPDATTASNHILSSLRNHESKMWPITAANLNRRMSQINDNSTFEMLNQREKLLSAALLKRPTNLEPFNFNIQISKESKSRHHPNNLSFDQINMFKDILFSETVIRRAKKPKVETKILSSGVCTGRKSEECAHTPVKKDLAHPSQTSITAKSKLTS